MQLRAISIPMLLLPCLLMTGCRKGGDTVPTYPVTGTVTLDGTAVADANVSFTPLNPEAPDAQPANGKTDASGVFKLKTPSGKEGARAGEYIVQVAQWEGGNPPPPTVTKKPTYEEEKAAVASGYGGPGSNVPGAKNMLPPKYNSAASGLKFTVNKEGKNEYTIELKK